MAITWQNVSAPNLGNPASTLAAGSNLVSSGLDRLSQVAQSQANKEIKNDRASLHSALLDSALNSGGDEKVFLRDSLKLAENSGLTPEQGLQEVDAVRGILNQMVAPTVQQQEQLQLEADRINSLNEVGETTLHSMLKSFDIRNPQAVRTASEVEAFQQNGGLDAVWSGFSSRFKEADDEYKTRKAINNLIADKGYDDFVVARVLERAALKDESFGPWGASRINSKQFRDQLDEEQDKFNQALQNSEIRMNMENNFRNAHTANIQAARDNLKALSDQIRKENLSVFTSNR
jgi:hypothetical protein